MTYWKEKLQFKYTQHLVNLIVVLYQCKSQIHYVLINELA